MAAALGCPHTGSRPSDQSDKSRPSDQSDKSHPTNQKKISRSRLPAQ